MKNLLFILSILLSFYSNSQDSLVVASSRYNVLYRGVPNLIKLGYAKMDTPCYIQGYNCDITNLDESGNYLLPNNYFVTPMDRQDATLVVSEYIDSITLKEIGLVKFYIRRLPDPILYFGAAETDYYASRKETRFFIKFHEDVLIDNFPFESISWRMTFKRKFFTGTGNHISEECSNYLKKLKKGGNATLTVKCKAQDNIVREISGNYLFHSDKFLNAPSDIPYTDEYGEPILESDDLIFQKTKQR